MRRGFRRLVIVVAVFIAAAVVVFGPGNYFAYRRHKVKETLSLLREPEKAIEEYARHHGEYPNASSFASLERVLGRADAQRDAWGNMLRYSGEGSHFLLWSAGADGKDDQAPLLLRNFRYDQVESRGLKSRSISISLSAGWDLGAGSRGGASSRATRRQSNASREMRLPTPVSADRPP